jgi:hypothetical protein
MQATREEGNTVTSSPESSSHINSWRSPPSSYANYTHTPVSGAATQPGFNQASSSPQIHGTNQQLYSRTLYTQNSAPTAQQFTHRAPVHANVEYHSASTGKHKMSDLPYATVPLVQSSRAEKEAAPRPAKKPRRMEPKAGAADPQKLDPREFSREAITDAANITRDRLPEAQYQRSTKFLHTGEGRSSTCVSLMSLVPYESDYRYS